MPYNSPATQSTGAVATAAWANSVKAALDFLANPPACRVSRGSVQSIPHTTATTLIFDGTESFDTDSMHSPATNPERITFNTAGLYLVTLQFQMETANDYDFVDAHVCRNAVLTGEIIPGGYASIDANGLPVVNLSGTYKFAAGDYITAYVYQRNTTSVARNVRYLADHGPIFTATWIGTGNAS